MKWLLLFLAVSPLVAAELTVAGRNSVIRHEGEAEIMSNMFWLPSVEMNGKGESYEYNLGGGVLINAKDRSSEFFLKKNAYVMFKAGARAGLYAGRKHFDGQIVPGWHDGAEGIGLVLQGGAGIFTLSLFDLYGGYLLEEDLYRSEEELPVSSSLPQSSGERIRHGALWDMAMFDNRMKLHAGLQYLRVEDWGVYADDDPDRQDGDYLYNGTFSVLYQHNRAAIGLLYSFSRGLDRIRDYNQDRSIAFIGELLSLYAGYEGKAISGFFSLYLPDSDMQDEAGNVTEIGYTGMGSFNFGEIVSYDLNYRPSAWIGENGLEKKEGIFFGRGSALLLQSGLKWKKGSFSAGASIFYLLAYETFTGGTGWNRRDFSKSFIAEGQIFGHFENEKGFIRLTLGGLFSNNPLYPEGEVARVTGGIKF